MVKGKFHLNFFFVFFFKKSCDLLETNKQNINSKALSAESGYEISFCKKWLVQQCCQILIIKKCKNRVVSNTEIFQVVLSIKMRLYTNFRLLNPKLALVFLISSQYYQIQYINYISLTKVPNIFFNSQYCQLSNFCTSF